MVIKINSESFEEEVVRSKTPVIVDFFAGWCGPCQMMAPVFEEFAKEYKDRLKFVKVDTEEDMELSVNNSVKGIPCLIVFNKGREVNRIVGFAPKQILKQKIDSIIGGL